MSMISGSLFLLLQFVISFFLML